MFDRLYQEQVTTKKGQSNWSITSLCSELVAKMAKDIGMTIRKGIVVPFLPCLVAFWGFHPYMFFKCFFVTCKVRFDLMPVWIDSPQLLGNRACDDSCLGYMSDLILN